MVRWRHELERSVKDNLHKLRLDIIDLLLIHWPNERVPLAETLRRHGQSEERGLRQADRSLEFHGGAARPRR